MTDDVPGTMPGLAVSLEKSLVIRQYDALGGRVHPLPRI